MMHLFLLLAVLAAPPATGYTAWVDRNDVVHLRFFDLTKGSPRNIYVHPDAQPTCAVCPPGPAPLYTLDGSDIYQKWHPGDHWVEAQFPTSRIGGLREFYFSATADASPPPQDGSRGETYMDGGPCPK